MPYYLPEGREDCMPEEQRKVPVARLGLMVVAFVAMVVAPRTKARAPPVERVTDTPFVRPG